MTEDADMIETLATGTRKARKEHQCWHCYRPIEKGTVYAFQTNKYDYVYTLKYHVDCAEAAAERWRLVGYYDEDGYGPLLDSIHDGDGQREIDDLRGQFPHVACRLEFHAQKRA